LHTSVLERFSEWSEQITQLLEWDSDFAELCSDYEELAHWLVAYSQDGSTSESDCTANRLLLKEMEVEILQYLQAYDRQAPSRRPYKDFRR
jgi:uncharacterized protein YdcH (DUF465 family)